MYSAFSGPHTNVHLKVPGLNVRTYEKTVKRKNPNWTESGK